MTIRTSRSWTPGAAAAVSSVFLFAFFFAGIWVGRTGVEYHLFGLVHGLAALLLLYVFLNSGVLSWPRGFWGFLVLVYAAVATAQLVMLLLPPPGFLEWVVIGVLVYFAWQASYATHRTRIMMSLGLVALVLAALKYSILPFLWARSELPRTPILDLRALGDGIKSLMVSYVPSRPETQALALLAILAWVLAVWLQWPPEAEGDWLRRLPRADRDRLLFWLLSERRGPGLDLNANEIRAYLDRGP